MTFPIIATEECYATESWFEEFFRIKPDGLEGAGIRIAQQTYGSDRFRKGLGDFSARLADMDAAGVDMHLLSIVTPGVQVFETGKAVTMARELNDALAAVIAERPTRYAGLAVIAPQDPAAAAVEIERATVKLGLNGIIINSYTNDDYIDRPKYDAILAAAAKFNSPIYLHPRPPAPSMIKPFMDYGLDGAIWGFAADGGLHALRLIMSGAFDRHPDLTMIVGHMGEGIPYFLWRIDNLYKMLRESGVGEKLGFVTLKKMPSEYFRSNVFITTSGMFSQPALRYCIDTIGADRIMFAIDYPFESSKTAVQFLKSADIPESDREDIAYKTAQRVFRLKPIAR